MKKRLNFSLLTLFILTISLFGSLSCSAPFPSKPSCNPRAPSAWCEAASGDACGKHKDLASCRADESCQGVPYQGESVIACLDDGKGFSTNCPSVGCISRCESLDEASCQKYAQSPWNACHWLQNRCEQTSKR